MFFIKRNKTEITTKNVAEVVLLNQETIVLGTFRFRGVQKGDFFVKDTVTIDIFATVEGNITALDCDINGLVKGNVFCANKLWLGSSAVIEGSIMAKKAFMETGCIVNGKVILAPEVEVLTLVPKIIAAEKIIEEERNPFEPRAGFSEKTDISQKSASTREIKTLLEEQKKTDVQKPESPLAQPEDNSNNWW